MPTQDELERYAEIRAAIDLGSDANEAIRAHGEAPETWPAFEARVLEEVADQIDRGDVTGLAVFQRVFDARRGERSDTDRPPPGPEPAVEPADPTEPVDVRAVREQLVVGAVPFDASARPAVPISMQAQTVDFAEQSGETMMTDGAAIRAMLAKSGALPFAEARGDAPPRPSTATTATVASLPTGTVDIDEALVSGDLLPFQQQPPGLPTERLPEPVVLQQIARAAAGVPKVTAPPRADAGLGPAVPFETRAPAQISLEEYAAISALLAREGDPMKTFARLGTTPDAWMSTVRAFGRMFTKDPAMEAQFDALVRKNKANAR